MVGRTTGRPLGMTVARDGRLLICTSPGGLVAMNRDTGETEVLVESVNGRRLQFCSNVVELPDGTIYFTESTAKFAFEHFKGAIFESRGDGGLFRRDPDGTVSTLLDHLYFANGLTPTVDGSALVFAETQARRLSKYWLTGPKAGTVTPLAVNLPGDAGQPVDGHRRPDLGARWCRRATPRRICCRRAPRACARCCGSCPTSCSRRSCRSVWAVAFDPDTGAAVSGVHMKHPEFGLVTGLVERDGRLWLATIGHAAVAHCPLPS